MNYNIVSYLIGEGFKNVLKNKKSTFAAFIIMFVTMITVGLGIAGGSNITSIINQLENDFPINVYIEDTASQDDIKDMEEQIKSIEYVNNVTYTSKEKALEKERENLGDTANVVLNSYTESNHPFPASFTVTLTDLEKSSEVIAYDDLGTEAIRKLYVEDFPVIVVIDSEGNNLYETAIKEYCRE